MNFNNLQFSATKQNIFCKLIIYKMSAKKKKKEENKIFDSIRKPTAPPSKKIGKDKPDEKVNPSLRKAKHKKKDTDEN